MNLCLPTLYPPSPLPLPWATQLMQSGARPRIFPTLEECSMLHAGASFISGVYTCVCVCVFCENQGGVGWCLLWSALCDIPEVITGVRVKCGIEVGYDDYACMGSNASLQLCVVRWWPWRTTLAVLHGLVHLVKNTYFIYNTTDHFPKHNIVFPRPSM